MPHLRLAREVVRCRFLRMSKPGDLEFMSRSSLERTFNRTAAVALQEIRLFATKSPGFAQRQSAAKIRPRFLTTRNSCKSDRALNPKHRVLLADRQIAQRSDLSYWYR